MFCFKYKCTLEKQINFQIFPVCPLFYLVFISRFGLTKAIIDSFMLISFIVLTQQCTEMYFFANKTMKKKPPNKYIFQERFSDLPNARAFFVWCSSRVSLSQRTDERRRPLQENEYTFGISTNIYFGFAHRGMNTRGEFWLLWKGPHVFCLICVLCDNFWTNYDLDLFSTSKWPSELQFCERYLCRWRKIG